MSLQCANPPQPASFHAPPFVLQSVSAPAADLHLASSPAPATAGFVAEAAAAVALAPKIPVVAAGSSGTAPQLGGEGAAATSSSSRFPQPSPAMTRGVFSVCHGEGHTVRGAVSDSTAITCCGLWCVFCVAWGTGTVRGGHVIFWSALSPKLTCVGECTHMYM